MKLENKKIVIISADKFEESELIYPLHRMREEGAEVIIAGTRQRVTKLSWMIMSAPSTWTACMQLLFPVVSHLIISETTSECRNSSIMFMLKEAWLLLFVTDPGFWYLPAF